MSETVTETAPEAGAEAAPATEDTTPQTAAETPSEAATEATETEQAEEKKPADWRELALKRETRLKHEARRELEQLRAELALMKAGRQDDAPPRAPANADDAAVLARAEALRAQERMNEQRMALIQQGVKEHGQDAWNEKTNIVAQLGATDNPAFMEALLDIPEAHKLVVELADNPDRLTALLAKRPAAMAAEMGRMAAEIAAPKTKALSSAPAPVKPITSRATTAEPDPAKMSMKEYIAWREKNAPSRLGGRRRA